MHLTHIWYIHCITPIYMYREWHSLSDTGPTTCQGSEDFLRVGLCSQELLLGESTLWNICKFCSSCVCVCVDKHVLFHLLHYGRKIFLSPLMNKWGIIWGRGQIIGIKLYWLYTGRVNVVFLIHAAICILVWFGCGFFLLVGLFSELVCCWWCLFAFVCFLWMFSNLGPFVQKIQLYSQQASHSGRTISHLLHLSSSFSTQTHSRAFPMIREANAYSSVLV